MSAAYGAGMGIGRALQDFGRAMYEDATWKERRKILAEEARAQLEGERARKREDLKYEASLKPPQVSEVEEVGEDGKRVKVRREWQPDFERGGGQYVERGRIPVMTERDTRGAEAEQYGLSGDARTAYELTGKLPRGFGDTRKSGGAAKPPAPAWRQVQAADGSYEWRDLNSTDGSEPIKAPPPYRERQGSKKKDEEEDDILAPKSKPGNADAVKGAKDQFAEDNKRKFPNAPPIGTVEDGMKYMGGDPTNENNWVPA